MLVDREQTPIELELHDTKRRRLRCRPNLSARRCENRYLTRPERELEKTTAPREVQIRRTLPSSTISTRPSRSLPIAHDQRIVSRCQRKECHPSRKSSPISPAYGTQTKKAEGRDESIGPSRCQLRTNGCHVRKLQIIFVVRLVVELSPSHGALVRSFEDL